MNLQLVPIEELLSEVMKRFDHSVFCGHREVKDDGSYYEKGDWHGSERMGVALCEMLKQRIVDHLLESEYDGEEGYL